MKKDIHGEDFDRVPYKELKIVHDKYKEQWNHQIKIQEGSLKIVH